MRIDRKLFAEEARQPLNNLVEKKMATPLLFSSPTSDLRRQQENSLNQLAEKIFTCIEKKQSETKDEAKLVLTIQPGTDEIEHTDIIALFLKKIYKITSTKDSAPHQGNPAHQATSKDIFASFFVDSFPGIDNQPVKITWKLNWIDNPTLRANPKVKPDMSQTNFPSSVSDSDRLLNEQRLAKELCDITLQVGDNQFAAHRIILANRSKYFRTMFLSGMKESAAKPTLEIKEIGGRDFDKPDMKEHKELYKILMSGLD